MAWRTGLTSLLLLRSEAFAASLVQSNATNSSSSVSTTLISSSSSHGLGALILQGLGSSQSSTSSSTSSSVCESSADSLSSHNTSAAAQPASGTIHNSAQITSPPNATNATSNTGNGSSVLVTAYSPWQILPGPFTFEPVAWYGNDPDLPRAESCWSALTSQELESYSYFTASVANRTWPITTTTTVWDGKYNATTVIYPTEVSTYKLCDGSPRVDAKPVTKTFTAISSATPTYSAAPPCGDPRDGELCYDWYRFSNLTEDWVAYDREDLRLLDAECGEPAHYDPNIFNATNWPCLIAGGPVQLYYFPVDTGSQNLCSPNKTTVSKGSPTTPPPTVVTDGHTLTSGSVYVSFQTLYAFYDGFHYGPGTGYSDFIMTLASSQISTNCGSDDGIGTMLNYADLNYPIAASAYSCAHPCLTSCVDATCTPAECSTIWDDFNPVMAVPTPVLGLQEAWKTCSFADENGPMWLFDPPIALTAAANEVKPTVPGGGGAEATSDPATAPVQALSSEPAEASPSGGGVTVPSPKPTPTSPLAQQTGSPGNAAPTAQPDTEPSSNGDSQPSPMKGGNGNNSPQSNDAAGSPEPSPSNGGNTPNNQNSPDPPDTSNNQDSPDSQQTPNAQGSQNKPQNSPDSPNNPPVAQLTVGDTTLHATQLPGNSIAIGDTTLAPGSVATISGVAISADPSGNGIVAGTQTAAFVQPSNNDPAAFAAGDMTITAAPAPDASSAVIVNGQTLRQGGSAVVVDGTTISQGPTGPVVINGESTQALQRVAGGSSVFAAGSLTVTASPAAGDSNAMIIDGTTLSPGGSAVVIDGQTISDGSDGLVAIGPSGTSTLSAIPTSAAAGEVMALGSLTITGSPVPGKSGVFVVDGTTLSPGGSAVVIHGTTLSDRSGTLVEVEKTANQALSSVRAVSSTIDGSRNSPAGPAASTTRSAAARRLNLDASLVLRGVMLSCLFTIV